MTRQLCIVDAFSLIRFAGNPAAVVVLQSAMEMRDPVPMQKVAAEMNLSETAFVAPAAGAGLGHYFLRWFTPTNEVPLCGHATLATAHVLFNEVSGGSKLSSLHFHIGAQAEFGVPCGTGGKQELVVTRADGDGSSRLLSMELPVGNPEPIADWGPSFVGPLNQALGLAESTAVTDVQVCRTTRKLVYRVASVDSVLACAPDFSALHAVRFPESVECRGVIVTAVGASERAPAGTDFTSRYFTPWNGIPEDPVTGSAHTVLGVYYSRLLGKRRLQAYQASQRGGCLTVVVQDPASPFITVQGPAVTVVQGSIVWFGEQVSGESSNKRAKKS